jgi:hypothetical protein
VQRQPLNAERERSIDLLREQDLCADEWQQALQDILENARLGLG